MKIKDKFVDFDIDTEMEIIYIQELGEFVIAIPIVDWMDAADRLGFTIRHIKVYTDMKCIEAAVECYEDDRNK